MNAKLFIPTLAAVMAGATLFGTSQVFAQDTSNSTYNTLVQKIAERFNLQQSDVQAVFDEVKNDRLAKHQERIEEKLTEAVEQGELTEEQKTKILAKHQEMMEQKQANWEKWKDMTREERRAEMEKVRTELETWAKDNNIDLKYLMPFKGGHHRGGFMWKEKR